MGESDGRARFEITDHFVAAAEAFGLHLDPDCNGETQVRCCLRLAASWKGLRVSGAHACLDPIRRRANLLMLTDTRFLGIEFVRCRANWVRARLDSENRRFACKGEVLLAAGAAGSPQLLMLSGVGPAKEIARSGISPVLDAAGIGKRFAGPFEGTQRLPSAKSDAEPAP